MCYNLQTHEDSGSLKEIKAVPMLLKLNTSFLDQIKKIAASPRHAPHIQVSTRVDHARSKHGRTGNDSSLSVPVSSRSIPRWQLLWSRSEDKYKKDESIFSSSLPER